MYLAIQKVNKDKVSVTKTLNPKEFLTTVNHSIFMTVSRHGQ